MQNNTVRPFITMTTLKQINLLEKPNRYTDFTTWKNYVVKMILMIVEA